LKLWEGLSRELNYNIMFSQRGVLMLAHNQHDVQSLKRHVYANRLNGIDNEWLSPQEAKEICPPLNISPNLRHPVLGAARQRRGGVARHDAVAWGYARAADALGVDIIENCEVLGFLRDPGGAVAGVETSRGPIRTSRVGVVAAGHTSVVMARLGLRMPLESFPLQPLLSAPGTPVSPRVGTPNTLPAAITRAEGGAAVSGRRPDQHIPTAQRGAPHIPRDTLAEFGKLFPPFSRLRMLRNWGGIVDVTPDR